MAKETFNTYTVTLESNPSVAPQAQLNDAYDDIADLTDTIFVGEKTKLVANPVPVAGAPLTLTLVSSAAFAQATRETKGVKSVEASVAAPKVPNYEL